MSAWTYCWRCANGLDRITVDQVRESASCNAKVACEHCGADRADDTPNERIAVLCETVVTLTERVDELSRPALPQGADTPA